MHENIDYESVEFYENALNEEMQIQRTEYYEHCDYLQKEWCKKRKWIGPQEFMKLVEKWDLCGATVLNVIFLDDILDPQREFGVGPLITIKGKHQAEIQKEFSKYNLNLTAEIDGAIVLVTDRGNYIFECRDWMAFSAGKDCMDLSSIPQNNYLYKLGNLVCAPVLGKKILNINVDAVWLGDNTTENKGYWRVRSLRICFPEYLGISLCANCCDWNVVSVNYNIVGKSSMFTGKQILDMLRENGKI